MSEDRIVTTLQATGTLTPAQWSDLWILTQEFFAVERDYAETELRKHQTVAMFHMNDALLGMAAIDILPMELRGRKVVVISTAHVLIRENWRGRNLLQKLGWRTFLRTRLRFPLTPIYWFFDTFSYKSYLLLPRNFSTYWPRYDAPTPAGEAALMDSIAAHLNGAAWQPARGIVAGSGQKRMRETAAPLILARDSDPNLAFFARVNPNHADGDRLVCLCPLSLRNWLTLGRKAFRRWSRVPTH